MVLRGGHPGPLLAGKDNPTNKGLCVSAHKILFGWSGSAIPDVSTCTHNTLAPHNSFMRYTSNSTKKDGGVFEDLVAINILLGLAYPYTYLIHLYAIHTCYLENARLRTARPHYLNFTHAQKYIQNKQKRKKNTCLKSTTLQHILVTRKVSISQIALAKGKQDISKK